MEPTFNISFFVALGAGALSFLSPCVLPLVPSYVSFVTGISLEALENPATRRQNLGPILFNSLAFIFGFSTVFISFGASFSLLGRLLMNYRPLLTKVGGAFVVLMGLYLMGLARFPFLMRERRLFNLKGRPAGALGAFFTGVAFAIGWTPCVGPVLGALLFYASAAHTATAGTVFLGAYSLGLGIPFLLSSLALSSFFQLFGKLKRHLRTFEVAAGILLVVMGILLFTGYFTLLNAYAIRLTPQWLWKRI